MLWKNNAQSEVFAVIWRRHPPTVNARAILKKRTRAGRDSSFARQCKAASTRSVSDGSHSLNTAKYGHKAALFLSPALFHESLTSVGWLIAAHPSQSVTVSWRVAFISEGCLWQLLPHPVMVSRSYPDYLSDMGISEINAVANTQCC